MRKTALLHIKFALCATHGLFSFLFIRCFGIHRKREREHRGPSTGVKYWTIVHSSPTRDPGAWPPAAVAAVVTLEIRDSQDRRNIAGRKPTERGPRQCRPVSGSRHDCFNTLRSAFARARDDRPCAEDLFEYAKVENQTGDVFLKCKYWIKHVARKWEKLGRFSAKYCLFYIHICLCGIPLNCILYEFLRNIYFWRAMWYNIRIIECPIKCLIIWVI